MNRAIIGTETRIPVSEKQPIVPVEVEVGPVADEVRVGQSEERWRR